MTTHRERNPVSISRTSVYSCSTYYSTTPLSPEPPSWYLLQSEIDRSLKTFDTHFDTSCFDEMEDQLLECPLESFAALCYQTAVARQSAKGPDWCVFIKTPNRVNWQEDEDTLDSEDSHTSLQFASIDSSVKPDSSFIRAFPTTNESKRDIIIDISLPFHLHDPTTVVPNPDQSIHYYPTVPRKLSRSNTFTKVFRQITSFPKFTSPSSR